MRESDIGNALWNGLTRRHVTGGLLVAALPIPKSARAQQRAKWVTSWAASSQGPFSSGAIVAMPDQSFASVHSFGGAQAKLVARLVSPPRYSGWRGHTQIGRWKAMGRLAGGVSSLLSA